ncbi:MAG: EamA/RhaT family transporter, partial [Amylibacter sp.]|nr:EamA/RhaT family transporter [Amylibacter sp.]
MTQKNTQVGIWLAVVAMFVFAMQDGISRHLAEQYSVFMIVMIRYWFFLLFVM